MQSVWIPVETSANTDIKVRDLGHSRADVSEIDVSTNIDVRQSEVLKAWQYNSHSSRHRMVLTDENMITFATWGYNPAHAKVGLFPAKDKRIGRFYYTREVRIKGTLCAIPLVPFRLGNCREYASDFQGQLSRSIRIKSCADSGVIEEEVKQQSEVDIGIERSEMQWQR